MTCARLNVDQWMAFGLGLETQADWVAWAGGVAVAVETRGSPVALPMVLRRRVTPLGQSAFRAASMLSVPEGARFIFCSRHGEFDRTLGILTALATGEPVSPAEFSLSVHNALAGLLSIAWQNRAGHTTIAAGVDSFGSAMIEALACILERPDVPVLLVYLEDPLPKPYSEIADSEETRIALALVLTAPRHEGSDIVLNLVRPANGRGSASASGQALSFLNFLLRDERAEGPQIDSEWRRA